jgi:hypothetical protein
MTPVAAGTAIGAAAVTVGRGAIGAVSNGLSFASELLRATGGGTPAQASNAPDPAAVARDAFKQRTDAIQQRIGQQLAAAGIQLTQPVDLVSNGQGGIAVAPPHPQQAAIEEVLGSDVLLERDFNQLNGDYNDFVESNRAGDLPATLTISVPKSA